MNLRNALRSLLELFAGFSFFAGAIFFFSLPFLPKVRLKMADALLASPNLCHLAGTFLMAASLVLIGGFYFLSRGRMLRISMGGNLISIDTAAVYKTVEECLKTHFDRKIALSDLYVARGGKLEIEVTLAPSLEPIEEDFASVQKRLAPLLEEQFGYSKPFGLTVKSSYSDLFVYHKKVN
jgi:hypothetical protein